MSDKPQTAPPSVPPAYRYLPKKNPQHQHLGGVPLRDLTATEVAALPAWLQKSLAACPFYAPLAPASPAPVGQASAAAPVGAAASEETHANGS